MTPSQSALQEERPNKHNMPNRIIAPMLPPLSQVLVLAQHKQLRTPRNQLEL
jgi:hypothetical protein